MSDIPCPIGHWAQAEPERPAIITSDATYTYRTHHEAVSGAAAQLSASGIEPGDVVAVSMPSPVEQIVAIMGIIRLGAVAAPLAPGIPDAVQSDRLGRIGAHRLLNESGIDAPSPSRISPARAGNATHSPPLKGDQGGCGAPQSGASADAALPHSHRSEEPEFRRRLHVTQPSPCRSVASAEAPLCGAQHPPALRATPFKGGLLAERSSRPSGSVPIPADRPATTVFTSGSSGEPKGAQHSYGNHYHAAQAANRNMPLVPDDRWLLSLGLHHVAGIAILFRCMVAGTAVAVPDDGDSLVESIERHDVTHLSLVSTQLYRLLGDDAARNPLARLKAILLGGGPIPQTLVKRALAWEWPIHTSYGLTETAAQIAATEPGAPLDTLLTSGRPLEPETIRTAADGEILVCGGGLFQGYLRDGRVERPDVGDGWFPTGDLGLFDAEGRLHVSGRKDSRFVCGGENVQPERIEQALCRVPGVVAALVVPLEDAEFGLIPVAFLRMDASAIPDPDTLRARLADKLERFSIPKRYLAWPEDLDAPASKADRAAFARLAALDARLAPDGTMQ